MLMFFSFCFQQQYICIHNCIVCVLEGNEEDTQFGEDNAAYNYDIGKI